MIDVNYFCKTLIEDVWQGSEQASDFEYASVLNILGLWINQGSEYTSGAEYVRVLDIARLTCQGYRVLNMPEYVWIIHEYAWLCLNMAKSSWINFVLHLLILIPYLDEP